MSPNDELRCSISHQILSALNHGVIPWRERQQLNPLTYQPYAGINGLLLSLHARRHGFRSRYWGTQREWKKLGGEISRRPHGVCPGEWGAATIYHDEPHVFLKTQRLFNLDQAVDVGEDLFWFTCESNEIDESSFERADALIEATGAEIVEIDDGECCYFMPFPRGSWPKHMFGDIIQMPPKEWFSSPSSFYKTALHEISHWAEIRTDFNSQESAMCEVVADWVSHVISDKLRLPPVPAPLCSLYLRSWRTALKNDANFIFEAAIRAERIIEYLWAFVPKEAARATTKSACQVS